MLTDIEDRDLRGYARWISLDDGEDAYHDAICDVLARGWMERIAQPCAFFRRATKLALYKIFRHEKAERENTAAFLAGDPPPTSIGLKAGRLPQTHCRRGHALTEENLAYTGPRRTCRICRKISGASSSRQYRGRRAMKEETHA